MREPIVHPGPCPELFGWEYRFPVGKDELGERERKSLTPWFLRFLGKSSDAVRQVLAEDWRAFDAGPALALRDALLACTPTSIGISFAKFVALKLTPLLVLTSPSSQWALLLKEPKPISDHDRKVFSSIQCAGLESLASFQISFSRGEVDCTGESFRIERQMRTPHQLTTRRWNAETEQRYGSWRHSVSIFYDGSGDELLLRSDGKLARWSHDLAWGDGAFDSGPCELDLSLDAMIDQLAEFIRNGNYHGDMLSLLGRG